MYMPLSSDRVSKLDGADLTCRIVLSFLIFVSSLFQFQLIAEPVGRNVVLKHDKLVKAFTRLHPDRVTDFIAVNDADRTQFLVHIRELFQIISVQAANVKLPVHLRRDEQLFRQLLLNALRDAVNGRIDKVVPL